LGDVLPLLNGHCEFTLQNGKTDRQTDRWDLIIAHPPCTDLAVSGARHFEKKRIDGRQRKSIEFFCKFLECDCDKVVIENPVGIISGDYINKWYPDLAKKYNLPIKPTQIIQPYEYGHTARKTTCLWLKGLQLLKPTKIVEPEIVKYKCKNGKYVTFSKDYCYKFDWNNPEERSKKRSKTYDGIAKAMAEQWG
jgi:site-specific DNA-cytosine methylase